MKKLLTLPNILKAAGALLGLVAFFLMFADQLFAKSGNTKGYVDFQTALFDKNYGVAIAFVGYLLVLLAALGLCALIFVKLDAGKMIALGLAGFLVLGAIFIFIEAAVFNGKFDLKIIDYHLAAGPVLAGIFAILAALLGCGSEFLPKK